MKHLLLISLLCCLVSCSEDSVVTEPEVTQRITFTLSGLTNDNLSTKALQTRAVDWIDFGKYTVKFYLFKENKSKLNPDTNQSVYVLESMRGITEPVVTVDVKPDTNYKYIFAATTTTQTEWLTAKDFGTIDFNKTPSYSSPEAVEGTSVMENCYFQLGTTDNFDYSGTATTTSRVNEELYADGYTINTSFNFSTPIGVVLRRQVGLVEFQLSGVKDGDVVSCDVPTDYYRLYFSQICKINTTDNYVSSNNAFSDNASWANLHPDYYSFVTNFNAGNYHMLSFIKKETLSGVTNSKYNFRIFMPYTTAKEIGSSVPTIEKANYKVKEQTVGDGVKLTINGTTYNYNQPFPIYRDGKTYFMIQGTQLVTYWSSGSDGGIDLDDDKWDGVTE